ncbi:MAG: S9 family peptidase [Xanthomonadales bacterium]|nr:S9 family peptidase [Xanthomonadales bacterium]
MRLTLLMPPLLLAMLLGACQGPPPRPEERSATAVGAEPIPRRLLFADPVRSTGRVSPDGRWLAWLAPHEGAMNLWVAPSERPEEARPLTRDRGRGIRNFAFAFDGRHLLYLRDQGGDENDHLFAVAVEGGEPRDLTPFPGAKARIEALSERAPGIVIAGVNDRDPRFFDPWRIEIATGSRERLLENRGHADFVFDLELRLRLATRPRQDGGLEVERHLGDGRFAPLLTIPREDALTTRILGFGHDDRPLAIDSRGHDLAALYRLDPESGERELIFSPERVDVSGVLLHPTRRHVQAVLLNDLRPEWVVLDPEFGADLERLRAELGEGEIAIASRSLDDRLWSVTRYRSDRPAEFFLYDRAQRRTRFWFATQPELAERPLARMHPLVIPSRDGLRLVSYLTLPRAADPDGDGRPDAPQPLVLLVHGGPWARDGYGFNALHQWLADRGYATLSVNFRGSTGFGKSFVNAGDREWAGRMHDDLIDAVAWAVHERVADPGRVAIMGGSYGGYATLVGLSFTPETFACGVDLVGPSNLITLLESIPPYWESFRRSFAERVGDPATEEGRRLLAERSPLFRADRIVRPLLIGQGANDPRVKQAESDQIVAALAARGVPVTYALFPDEGHAFARAENRLAFWAIAEGFLARCLGGRSEPIGRDLEGSSLTVPKGAEHVPGLGEALARHRPEIRM